MEKILLDTDIGSDIDDAVCLAYLLANPACDLLGITTVSGEAELRAQLASVLCRVAGRDVPIYPGVEVPFLVEQRQKIARQAAALSRWPHQETFPQGGAVEFLRRTIHAHPGEVTLLTIGPLTNIGLLLASDPQIPRLLKRLVLMCGVFTTHMPGAPRLEWNAMLDPHATAIVYRSPIVVHRSIGLDVTLQVTLRRLKCGVASNIRACSPCWILRRSGSRNRIKSPSTTRWLPRRSSTQASAPSNAGGWKSSWPTRRRWE